MTIFFKPDLFILNQTAMVFDGQQVADSFTFELSNAVTAIQEYCQSNPRVDTVKICGNPEVNMKYKKDLDMLNLTNFSNNNVQVELM